VATIACANVTAIAIRRAHFARKEGRMIADDLNLSALAAEIIRLAINEARWKTTDYAVERNIAIGMRRRAAARAFLNGGDLDFWCSFVNLNADSVRAAIRDGLLDRRPAKRVTRYPQSRANRKLLRERAEMCAA
jgi:hypothetical protein